MPWFRSKSVSDGSEDKSSKNSQPDSTEQAAVPEMGNTGEKTDNSHVTDTHTDVKEYPGLKIVLPIVLSVCLVVFLAALDRTIVGVAVPAISNDYNSFDEIAWYESSFLLTNCAFQLPLGKTYTFFPVKWVFIICVIIFEVGSIVSAASPTSIGFIIGRAISGLGAAGTFTGGNLIFVELLPLEKRAKFVGFIGATFGLASIAGPLLGGVFTTDVSWRWCFWINVPIGVVATAVLFFILPAKSAPRSAAGKSLRQRLWQFDPIGTVFLMPGLILLLLALQWGGIQYAWSSAQVIVLLVVGLVLLTAFAITQVFVGENGTLPPRIVCQRSVAAASAISVGIGSCLIILTFYLPIWFQAIKNLSAVEAGIRLLAYFLTTVFFVIGSGFVVSKIGYYTPVLMVGVSVLIIGCGLLSTFEASTGKGMWVGYQIVVGAGMGTCLIQAQNAVQTVLSEQDIPIGITVISFAQFLGGAIFVPVCQAVLTNTLTSRLNSEIPDLDTTQLAKTGATNISGLVPEAQLPILLAAYNQGIVYTFFVALGMACVALIASFFLEWKSMKKQSVRAETAAP